MALASGALLEVTEDQPELLRKVRASYGTFGIVYEVTFRVRPIVPMSVYHRTYQVDDFIARLPELKKSGHSMMFFMFPFADKITVEFRKYNPGAAGKPNRALWRLRNYVWATAAPKFARYTESLIPVKSLRYGLIDWFYKIVRFSMEYVLHSANTLAPDQTIRYPSPANDGRYTFSLFAFPESVYPKVLKEYFEFNRDYYLRHGYRSNMLSVGYRIAQDSHSLLSYSHDGPVMTLDPVSTANPGWDAFLDAYNNFCVERGGRPLFNQTPGLTRKMAVAAFGDRLSALEATRAQYDPHRRLLNAYFAEMFGSEARSAAAP
jgi:FAD/FMN-containing dehydrogenase